jgi:predicted RNase H-like HicB family nuclease
MLIGNKFGGMMYLEGFKMKFNIILAPAEEGGFNVTVPALEGCFTQGETEKEALKALL